MRSKRTPSCSTPRPSVIRAETCSISRPSPASPAYHGLAFHETFGMYGYLMKLRAESLRDLGGAMSPFNAFLFLLGVETLSLRMDRHVENTLAVARWLAEQPGVAAVRHPGVGENPLR